MEFNIFKLEYNWGEDHEEKLLGKNAERKDFERDLSEAKRFAKQLIGKKVLDGDYLGKGYSTECVPEYYEQIIWFLTNKKGYHECCLERGIDYIVEYCDREAIKVRKLERIINEFEID